MKKKTKSTKTQKKVNKLSQAHGKEDKFVPTTLDQVWGDDGVWKYDTSDERIYEDRLKSMTRIDIQTHATKIGLIPVDNRDTLEKRLMREFRRHIASYQRPNTTDSSVELSKEARQILEEGR
jgi:hypothetical protein